MDLSIILFAVLIGIILLALFIRDEYRGGKKRLDEAFEGRAKLTCSEFHGKYFKELDVDLAVVEGVRSIFEEQFDADMSQLISEDDFSQNLSFLWAWDSMADVEIVNQLEEKFHIKITDNEAEQAHTVKDIVLLVSRKVKNS
ncbi:MAG: acyl carrier protein [Glaciecola sp.]|jgi:acyl carrier protein